MLREDIAIELLNLNYPNYFKKLLKIAHTDNSYYFLFSNNYMHDM